MDAPTTSIQPPPQSEHGSTWQPSRQLKSARYVPQYTIASSKNAYGRPQVHQIQSGQVIVDLCSVVKELVENALDASATSLEIRFKNNGLDSIEIADNGAGIAPEDFDSLALKHYTSKLAKYDDLTSLTTFGFRGEALSSLCALSKLSVVTSRAEDAPKATKLEFETSGKVKSRTVVASQKGTTVAVEEIFRNLPVRRRELEKNIKREYQKVLGLLHAYSCISTGVRFSVSNTPSKGKKVVVFSTKSNPTTRENIANVYGAKTLVALLPLDLVLELHPTTASTQSARNWSTQADTEAREVRLKGHISRPVIGEGRQTPDRQMFFVNSRPCALPQVSKAINEVYRGYNVTQSPFIFANLELDTSAYDVNVSPDKRTILLHDQTALLEALKESLTELFEKHDQSVPQAATPSIKKLPSFKPLSVTRPSPVVEAQDDDDEDSASSPINGGAVQPSSIIRRTAEGDDLETREDATKSALAALAAKKRREAENAAKETAPQADKSTDKAPEEALHNNPTPSTSAATPATTTTAANPLPQPVQDFNARLGIAAMPLDNQSKGDIEADALGEGEDEPENAKPADQMAAEEAPAGTPEERIPSVSNTPQKVTSGVVPNAFDRMRPKRTPQDVATITIGNQTTSMTLGTPENKRRRIHTPKFSSNGNKSVDQMSGFVSSLRAFSAPGSTGADGSDADDVEDDEDSGSAKISSAMRSKSIPTARPHPLTSSMSATITSLESDQPDAEDHDIEGRLDSALFLASEDGSDDEYMDDAEKKAREEAKIAKLIELAEERAAKPSTDNVKRATSAMKGRIRKDSTLQLMQTLKTSADHIERTLKQLARALKDISHSKEGGDVAAEDAEASKSAEERLSLTVSKNDFGRMRVIGQFNHGFILATRTSQTTDLANAQDELFIIDQHASDEKHNFERLQSQTIVQNQRLVHPKQLDLTAIEEEVILNHSAALEKNGFEISIDTSGDSPVGQRCKLTSLPMSREVTFSLSDLEELLSLLSDQGESASTSAHVPRPSKVRKMFAMRACRSSIMVGKTLTMKQMERVVRHMGELDKPWNCPHGRPTMRHLFSMSGWNGWSEGEGLAQSDEDEESIDWEGYVEKARDSGLLEEKEVENEVMEEDPKQWLFTQKKADVDV